MEAYELFEKEFSRKFAKDMFVVACSSGTAALHLALETFNLPLGSEVILPNYCMVACARAVVLAGLKPVFVDCEPTTFNIDAKLLNKAISKSTSAVLVVHNYGRKCDMNEIVFQIQNKDASIGIVEDLAEGHGINPNFYTDVACWSFYKNKIVAGEEGGAVSFRHRTYRNKAKSLRSLGFTDEHNYTHIPRGHNYRMSNAHAKLINANMAEYGRNSRLRERLVDIYEIDCKLDYRMPLRDANWVYDFRIPGLTRAIQKEIVETLRKEGIPARYGFVPMSLQDEFKNCTLISEVNNAERFYTEIIYLNLDLDKDEADEYMKRTMKIVDNILKV